MTRNRAQSRDNGAWLDRVDWARVARGASSGFTVLVFSGLVDPMVSSLNPVAGLVFLVVGALGGSVLAACRARSPDAPVLSGASAALLSYTLVVPLIYMAQRRLDFRVVLGFAALAVVVGGVSGLVAGRRRPG